MVTVRDASPVYIVLLLASSLAPHFNCPALMKAFVHILLDALNLSVALDLRFSADFVETPRFLNARQGQVRKSTHTARSFAVLKPLNLISPFSSSLAFNNGHIGNEKTASKEKQCEGRLEANVLRKTMSSSDAHLEQNDKFYGQAAVPRTFLTNACEMTCSCTQLSRSSMDGISLASS